MKCKTFTKLLLSLISFFFLYQVNAATPQLPIGMNVQGLNYYTSGIIFTDAMTTASTMMTFVDGGSDWNTGKIDEIPKDEDKIFMEKFIQLVEENLDNASLDVNFAAKHLFVNRTYLYKKVKKLTGKSVKKFIQYIRIRKAGDMLSQTSMSVQEVIWKVGFSNRTFFNQCFKEAFGCNPSEYKNNVKP